MEYLLKRIFDISQSTLQIILFIELSIGIIGNGFMALVNCMDWVKRKKMSLVNQILTALATSRICLLWFVLVHFLITLLDADLATTRTMPYFTSNLWTIANHISIWLATCLGVFYFFKIANFSNSPILYLMWRVRKVVSLTLLVSLFLLFSNILLLNLGSNMCITEYDQINMSFSFVSYYHANCERHVLHLHIIFLSVPFVLSLSTFLLLIFSLWMHYKKMQQHVQGCRDASTMALQSLANCDCLSSTILHFYPVSLTMTLET